MPSSSSSHVLRISPKELNFPPPYNRMISSVLTIHNSSADYAVAYKVKTTAPQRYCVRPNTGLLPPGDTVEVQVLLNHTKDAPSIDSEDKFQIQSIILKESFNDIKEVWAKATPDQIIKQKLKAKFSPPTNKQSSSTLREDNSDRKAEGEHVIRGEEIHTGRSVPVVTFQLPPQTTPITATPEVVASIIQPELLQKYESPTDQDSARATATPTNTVNSLTQAPSTTVITPNARAAASSLDVHASLRKALDQVVSLTTAKESILSQNRDLAQQVSTLQKLVTELQEKTHSEPTLRQRVVAPQITATSDTTTHHHTHHPGSGNKQLIILAVVILLAFFLGRWTASG